MIPVFITNRDLLTAPLALANRVAKMGGRPIIVDNDSEYQGTLDWYASTRFEVVRLGENKGQRSAWDSGVVSRLCNERFERYADGPYVVTDGDLDLSECPDDTLEHLEWLLDRNPDRQKVGLSLRIDNIPDHNIHKAFIVSNESKFWEKRIPFGFDADIETTFAMYRRGDVWRGYQAMRTDKPYTAIHTPWYWDEKNLPDDAACYLRRAVKQWTGYTALFGRA